MMVPLPVFNSAVKAVHAPHSLAITVTQLRIPESVRSSSWRGRWLPAASSRPQDASEARESIASIASAAQDGQAAL